MQDIVRLKCSDGKTRNGYKIICEQCGKDHIVRIRKSQTKINRFCSQKCCNEHKHIRCSKEVSCAWCNSSFRKKNAHLAKSKSGLYFCTRKCKDEAQKLGGIKEIQPPHFGTSNPAPKYRQIYIDAGNELICRRCGYKEFKVSVQIHHIDENRKHNTLENLTALCANCHWALHNGDWKL